MKTYKKASHLIFAFCILHWPLIMLECAITGSAASSSSKATYATADDKGQQVSSSILGSIYHKSRQSRCVTCYEDRRYGDDRSRYYGSYAARSGDDRASSWYYSSYDRYDDRGYRGGEYDRYGTADRYGGADRYGADRYSAADRNVADRYGSDRYGVADRYAGYRDDRYAARPPYDRYDTRTRGAYDRPAGYERGESRGYGYDNRDRYYGDYSSRDRYYERPRYGSGGAAPAAGYDRGYDRDYYDRYSPRYDYRPYRPYRDDAYSSDRVPYYSGKGQQEDRRYLPEPNYYQSPCGARKPNCPYNPQGESTRVTSGTIDSGYNMGVSHTTYNTNGDTNHNESSKGSGASNGWSYMREDEQAPSRGGSSNSGGSSDSNNNNNNRDRDRDRSRDQQSAAYGALLDRGSNLIGVEPVKSNENADNSEQQQANGDASSLNDKKPENEQNS